MTNIAADVRYAIRMLVKSPGFAAVAIATLALAIGVNTAIFSLVDTVVLKPLPYPDPDRLVVAHESDVERGIAEFSVSPPNYFDWRDRNHSFQALAALHAEEGRSPEFPAGQRKEFASLSAPGSSSRLSRSRRPSAEGSPRRKRPSAGRPWP
jgi:hypothetical protein